MRVMAGRASEGLAELAMASSWRGISGSGGDIARTITPYWIQPALGTCRVRHDDGRGRQGLVCTKAVKGNGYRQTIQAIRARFFLMRTLQPIAILSGRSLRSRGATSLPA